MADAFLRELFRSHNRVQSEDEQTCVICMDICGTMSPETGLAEFAIRLPSCKHIVGSGCIAKWLQSNDTCPMCRDVLFSTQSGPSHEHSDTERQIEHVLASHARTVEHSRQLRESHRVLLSENPTVREQIMNGPISDVADYLVEIKLVCDRYCTQLGLRQSVADVTSSVASNLLDRNSRVRNFGDRCVLAVSIYIASNLTGSFRSPREISGVVDGIDRHTIRDTYDLLTGWSAIIDDGILDKLYDSFNIETLNWPPTRNELNSREADLENLIGICGEYSGRLDLNSDVATITRRIAARVWNIGSLRHSRRYPRTLAVACVYMAGYMTDRPRSMRSLSRELHLRPDDIAEAYHHMYDERRAIVQENWLPILRKDTMPRALAALPPM